MIHLLMRSTCAGTQELHDGTLSQQPAMILKQDLRLHLIP
uniref:Uncharacterized protein n=1 Tax=Arundo donax TaxID=35708 RepID=A0A0A8XQJ9_ARUDO